MSYPKVVFFFVLVFVAIFVTVDSSPWNASDHRRNVRSQNSTINRFPYQVSLRGNGQHYCGGSIVKLDVIITAAHCIPWLGFLNGLSVVAGTSYHTQIGLERKLKDVRVHPDYELSPTRYDVALLVLAKPLYYSDVIQPINLPKHGDVTRAGTKAIVSGWGFLGEDGACPEQLHYTRVHIISNEECTEKYNKDDIGPDMICAEDDNIAKDSCQSDFGGPLVVENVLIGIVSLGEEDARLKYPGVYTRVAYVRDWINGQLESLGY